MYEKEFVAKQSLIQGIVDAMDKKYFVEDIKELARKLLTVSKETNINISTSRNVIIIKLNTTEKGTKGTVITAALP